MRPGDGGVNSQNGKGGRSLEFPRSVPLSHFDYSTPVPEFQKMYTFRYNLETTVWHNRGENEGACVGARNI